MLRTVHEMKPKIKIYKKIFYIISLSLFYQSASAAEIKAIAIEYLYDQSQTMLPGLKAQYQLCVQLKETQQKTKREHPEIWPKMKKSLKPGYDVDSKPAAEPDWEGLGVGKTFQKEYFYGNQYAKYTQLKNYKISKDGRCSLMIDISENREIDNGEDHFRVSMKGYITNTGSLAGASANPPYQKIKVRRNVSPVITRIENDRELHKLVTEHPNITRYLNTLLDSGANRTPGTNPGISKLTIDILRESFGIQEDKGTLSISSPRANDEHFILGHACDIVSSSSLRTRQWYYKRMHHYPTIMRRPIILKSEVEIGKAFAIKEAARFQILETLDDKIFTPPKQKR